MRIKNCLTFLFAATCLCAADWPQWLGPNRSGVSEEKDWDRSLPNKEALWSLTENVSHNHSVPSIVGNRCYVFGAIRGKGMTLSAYDVETGEQVWQEVYEPTGEKVNGHATPTVDGDWIYTYDSGGGLRCWNKDSGKLRWERRLGKERGAFTGWHGMTCVRFQVILSLFRREIGRQVHCSMASKRPWVDSLKAKSWFVGMARSFLRIALLALAMKLW